MPRLWNGLWEYPLIDEALAGEGMEPIGVYIFHTIVAQYITTNPIFDISVAEDRRPGSSYSM